MGFVKDAKGRGSRALVGGVVCSILFLCLATVMAQAQTGIDRFKVEIDLDRSTADIDDGIDSGQFSVAVGGVVQGRVVLTGVVDTDKIGPSYGAAVTVSADMGATVDDTATTLSQGDAEGSPSEFIDGTTMFRTSVNFTPVDGITSGQFTLYNFDLAMSGCQNGEMVSLDYIPTSQSVSMGVGANDTTFGIRDGANGIPAELASFVCGDATGEPPTNTPTNTPMIPCEDAGYFVLDSFGGRHRVGNAAMITGSLYFGNDVARDMERTVSGATAPVPELAVLDAYGAVQFVQNPGDVPAQGFYFPAGTPNGFAVDVVVADSNDGFWVLTEQGGIYRAGTALPGGAAAGDPLGGDAANLPTVLGIPFVCPGTIGGPERDPGLPCPDNFASIRAVGFVVVQSGDPAAPGGYVILDSQGGHYIYDADGNVLDDDVDGSILNGMGGSSETVYPFWAGLDIGRDIEIAPEMANGATKSHHLSGLVIYDGWGGVHPVPVDPGSPVDYLRNDGLTSVGLPYIMAGFDDPNTMDDESPSFDVSSAFTDIEFCSTGQEGVYVLDRFGGVFAFGATRTAPDSVQPMWTGGPYFFPNPYAEDLEPETAFMDAPF